MVTFVTYGKNRGLLTKLSTLRDCLATNFFFFLMKRMVKMSCLPQKVIIIQTASTAYELTFPLDRETTASSPEVD